MVEEPIEFLTQHDDALPGSPDQEYLTLIRGSERDGRNGVRDQCLVATRRSPSRAWSHQVRTGWPSGVLATTNASTSFTRAMPHLDSKSTLAIPGLLSFGTQLAHAVSNSRADATQRDRAYASAPKAAVQSGCSTCRWMRQRPSRVRRPCPSTQHQSRTWSPRRQACSASGSRVASDGSHTSICCCFSTPQPSPPAHPFPGCDRKR